MVYSESLSDELKVKRDERASLYTVEGWEVNLSKRGLQKEKNKGLFFYITRLSNSDSASNSDWISDKGDTDTDDKG